MAAAASGAVIRPHLPPLQFPPQGDSGRAIDVPFVVGEWMTVRDLIESRGVCQAWRGFVDGVASHKRAVIVRPGSALPLQFPPQSAVGESIDVPSTIHELMSNRELAVSRSVCKAWRAFVGDVVSRRSAKLRKQGVQLAPAPSRVLQQTVRSYAEIQEKMGQFFAHLDPSQRAQFLVCGPDGSGFLRIRNYLPNDLSFWSELPAHCEAFDPAANDVSNPQYVMPSFPKPPTVLSWTNDPTDQIVEMPVMRSDKDTMQSSGWRRRRNGRAEEYQSRIRISGALPVQLEALDAGALKERVQTIRASMAKVNSGLERQLLELISLLPPDLRSSLGEIMRLLSSLQPLPERSAPLFLGMVRPIESLVLNMEKVGLVLGEILEDPAIRERLTRFGETLLPFARHHEVKKLLRRCVTVLEGINRQPRLDVGSMRRAFEPLKQELDRLRPILTPVLAPLQDSLRPQLEELWGGIRPIIEKHFVAAAPAGAAAADEPAAGPFADFQAFVDFAQSAMLQRQAALRRETTLVQRQVVNLRNFLDHPVVHNRLIVASGVGLLAAVLLFLRRRR